MYAVFYKNNNKNSSTKTYNEPIIVDNTNNVDWDDTHNSMNDEYASVTTGDATWVWLFADENCNAKGTNIIVPQNSPNYDLQANGFCSTVGSFQVLNKAPLLT
jgi:hypothetical protein